MVKLFEEYYNVLYSSTIVVIGFLK